MGHPQLIASYWNFEGAGTASCSGCGMGGRYAYLPPTPGGAIDASGGGWRRVFKVHGVAAGEEVRQLSHRGLEVVDGARDHFFLGLDVRAGKSRLVARRWVEECGKPPD